jgi:hypothetical protein
VLFIVLERERPLGRSRCRWKDNIEIDLREVRCEGVDWAHIPQDGVQWWALVNTVMNLWIT